MMLMTWLRGGSVGSPRTTTGRRGNGDGAGGAPKKDSSSSIRRRPGQLRSHAD
jgi:hypothetical protein